MSEKSLKEYNTDKRTPCRYGMKCFQKNPAHGAKYKHPPGHNKRKVVYLKFELKSIVLILVSDD